MSNKTLLITGSSGFIGQSLIKTLSLKGYFVRGTVRSENSFNNLLEYCKKHNLKNVTLYNLGELTQSTDWGDVLLDVDTIIHCAARAHVLRETSLDPLNTFRQINCHATEHLAKEAQTYKVRRIIFISSIGVLGNSSHSTPFSENSLPNPQLPYAQSKLEAECSLIQISKNIETVIIRPPLVYGPGVKGNFKKLLDLVSTGIPLPFGAIKNKRQFIGIDNLIDLIIKCVESPKAANQIFLASDKENITTSELIKLISKLIKKKIILLPIPSQILKKCLHAVGKGRLSDQLINNLEILPGNTKSLLEWDPPYTMLEQLESTIEYYQNNPSDV